MTEHKNPEVFPEHLRPHLWPIPETRWEALFLLRGISDYNLERWGKPETEKCKS